MPDLPGRDYYPAAPTTADEAVDDAIKALLLIAAYGFHDSHGDFLRERTIASRKLIREARAARPTVRINTGHRRTITVYVNGERVAHTNYDDVGWAGLDMLANTTRKIAAAAGLTVEDTEGDDDED